MTNKEEMYNFLRLNGFELIEQDKSRYFGDYYDIFANDKFELRFSSSKSYETIDVRSIEDKESWFDLSLVEALLGNNLKLNTATTFNSHIAFLKSNFNSIGELFNKASYLITKIRLLELANERARLMFPGKLH